MDQAFSVTTFRLFQFEFNYKFLQILMESLPVQAWRNVISVAILNFLITPCSHTPSIHCRTPYTRQKKIDGIQNSGARSRSVCIHS